MPNLKLGELLVRANILQESQLKAALVEQKRWGGKLGDILVRMSLVTEEILSRALSKQLGIPAVNLTSMESPGPEVLRKIPLRVAEDIHVVPLQLKDEGRTLVVAMGDPMNVQFLDTLRAVSGCRIAPMLAGRNAIDRAQGRFYRGESEMERHDEGESFKVVDSQGRTLVKNIAEISEGRTSQESPPPESTVRPTAASTPAEQLKGLEETQRREVGALKAMVELLVERGVFTRDEYLAKVRK